MHMRNFTKFSKKKNIYIIPYDLDGFLCWFESKHSFATAGAVSVKNGPDTNGKAYRYNCIISICNFTKSIKSLIVNIYLQHIKKVQLKILKKWWRVTSKPQKNI